MKRILLSLSVIAAVVAIAAGVTTAFYQDTETSTGNTFAAGGIDLKVDSTAHYNGMVCVCPAGAACTWQPETNTQPPFYPAQGSACTGTWGQTDLKDGIRRFFDYKDLKPGDHGEDTVSLHVLGNDAWGKFEIANVKDLGIICADPETDLGTVDADCNLQLAGTTESDGELRENLIFSVWLDQGTIPGFQNNGQQGIVDPQEGDNILQKEVEPIIITPGTIDAQGESYLLSDALKAVYVTSQCTVLDGHTNYDRCHGIAQDGRMVGSAVYYFGIDWDLPLATGNEIQTDELQADLIFKAVQQRNNPTQQF